MGIFTKKREESSSNPIQESSPRPRPEVIREREPEPEPDTQPTGVGAAQPWPEASPKPAPGPEFGIQNAMELMRKLPPDNIPLVVSVVKTTLESLNIDVESIIDDAKQKRSKIAERISGLEAEIADFEEEVAARRQEIKALQEDAAETKTVQERLQLATRELAPPVMTRPELAAPLLRPPAG